MHGESISYAYGFWNLVVVNVGLFAYYRLSKREEEMIKLFGNEYRRYMDRTPMFIPRLGKKVTA
ncbi:MAG: hypothetical protein AB1478_10195 [Nitrospirota bacterium]